MSVPNSRTRSGACHGACGGVRTDVRSGIRSAIRSGACPQSRQAGVSLLEALIAILLFSFGILGIIALQASSIVAVGDSNARAQAALLGEQILGRMWTDSAQLNAYALNTISNSCGVGSNASTNPSVTAWLADLALALPMTGSLRQGIEISQDRVVTVVVCWQGPKDIEPHRFTIATQII